MTTLSNSNLESTGVITVVPRPKRNAVEVGMHFVTAHLDQQEVRNLIQCLITQGTTQWGTLWLCQVKDEISHVPVPEQLELPFV